MTIKEKEPRNGNRSEIDINLEGVENDGTRDSNTRQNLSARGRDMYSQSTREPLRETGRNLYLEGRSSNTELERRGDSYREIRANEREVFEGEQISLLQQSNSRRKVHETSTRDTSESGEDVRRGNSKVSRSMASNGNVESTGSIEMGRDDEQHSKRHRRDDLARDNIYLNNEFPTEVEQKEMITRAGEENSSAFVISQKTLMMY